jgi:hypothetical protein
MRSGAFIAGMLLALFGSVQASAQSGKLTDDALYKAETVVTGTGEAERMRGFREGAEEVAIKLTGNAGLAGRKQIEPILDGVTGLVAEHSYEDRMKGIPIHDEQGTRDRPHYLRITFDKAKFDAGLRKAGLRKWSERPPIVVWLGVRDTSRRYVLASDGPEGYGQREVLKDISEKRGVPIILPSKGQIAVTYDSVQNRRWHLLEQETKKLGAEGVLAGVLEFDGNVGWNTRWALVGPRTKARWSMKGVTFDVALKRAIERTAAAFAKTSK